MNPIKLLPLIAALSVSFVQPAAAQQPRTDVVLSLAQAERNAADLRRGMSADDVRRLLGKPKRTGLKDNGGPGGDVALGALQWVYVWSGSGGPGTLHIDFVSKAPEEWHVQAWEWSAY